MKRINVIDKSVAHDGIVAISADSKTIAIVFWPWVINGRTLIIWEI